MNWSATWLLKFNVSKCKVVHYDGKNPEMGYYMRVGDTEVTLPSTTEEKDLGVLFDRSLAFRKHIAAVCSKPHCGDDTQDIQIYR